MGVFNFAVLSFDPAERRREICTQGIVKTVFDEGDGECDILFEANLLVVCIGRVVGGFAAFDRGEVKQLGLGGGSNQGHLQVAGRDAAPEDEEDHDMRIEYWHSDYII
jgi:hypothetical protein